MAYKPIESYGVIGDLHTVALVGMDGSIDWCCLPHFDSPSVFGAILDEQKGGFFKIASLYKAQYKQMYLPDSNVLVTRFLSADGVGEVIDFMPVHDQSRGRTTHQIVRVVRAVRGAVRFRLECQPAFDYARRAHQVTLVGRGAKGVDPSHRENGKGQQGKGFSAKTITYRSAGEAAQEGEGEQDAGCKPGRGRDADRRRMGSERHPVRERKECQKRRAHGPRLRPGKQQIDKHRRSRLAHQCAREARDGSGGEIKAGAHRERSPMLALSWLTRPATRDRHQYGEAKDHRPYGRPHEDRISITEGDEAEWQPNKTAEHQAKQQPRRDRRQQPPKHDDR